MPLRLPALRAAVIAISLLSALHTAESQAATETLRGQVLGDSARPVASATIIVTRAPDRLVQQTIADAQGRWSIAFTPGTGDYLVFISAPTFTAVRRRATREVPSSAALPYDATSFTIDVTLKRAPVQTLATIDVVSKKPKPSRDMLDATSRGGIGNTERDIEGIAGRASPDQDGNIALLAATTPGITATGGGFSALGLSAAQSNTTLGGMQLSAQDLPREMRTLTRVATTAYDPARGWFGGAQVSIEMSPGLQYAWSNAHLTLDAPAMQSRVRGGTSSTVPVTNVQASYGREGGLANDQMTFSLGLQGSRRAQDVASLLSASPSALQQAGISLDSVVVLRAALAARGIPLTASPFGSPWGTRTEDRLSFAGRIGTSVFDYLTMKETNVVRALTSVGSWRRTSGVGLSPSAIETRAGEAEQFNLGVMGSYTRYITPRSYLLDLKTGVSVGLDTQTPYESTPGGTVLVGGAGATDAAPALTSLAFGGNGSLASKRRTGLWESQGSLAFYLTNHNRHEFRIASDIRLDVVSTEAGSDRYGTFRYQSLSALQAGEAASFSRTLSSPTTSGAVWNGFISAGDIWRVRPGLRVQYGVRLEGNVYATTPTRNDALAQSLGVVTSHAPNTIALSPRIGFTWRRSVASDGYSIGQYGQMRIPSMTVMTGGVGRFRSMLTPDLAALARGNTGLPDGTLRVLCTGPAVPTAVWGPTAQAPWPTSCANGAPSSFADLAPAVSALGANMTAPSSWRANLAYSTVHHKTSVTVEGLVSLNTSQFGVRDANFAGVSRFVVAGEGRPIYVTPASIVVSTGAVSAVESRTQSAFGSVLVQHSDLRSLSQQLSVSIAPSTYHQRWIGNASYVLASNRARASGFDGVSALDPRALSWARGDLDTRHQFLLSGGVRIKAVTTTLFARVASGTPFTPMVARDINGDGLNNDAAFVPVASVSSLSSNDVGALRARSQPHTQRCLDAAVGRIAERNACTGPWTASVNARVDVSGASIGLGQRTKIGLNLSNPLGGLDQLLHGANALRGWGTPAFPDRTLLYPRSFSPATQTFLYDVNPRFGDTRPRAGAMVMPFRVTLDVSVDLTPPMPTQQMSKWLGPGRDRPGKKFDAKALTDRFMRSTPDVYRTVLAAGDSLLLSRAQVEALQKAQQAFRAQAQTLWEPLAAELAQLGNDYSARRAAARQRDVANTVWDLVGADAKAVMAKILSPSQFTLLPTGTQSYVLKANVRQTSYFFF